MDQFRMGQAADLLGISVDSIRRMADAERFVTQRSAGGHRLVDGAELARFAVELAEEARTDQRSELSARNRFTGLVTRVVANDVMAQVEIQAGAHRIVSLISAEAVHDLALAPGVLAVAAVKATNVIIERPS